MSSPLLITAPSDISFERDQPLSADLRRPCAQITLATSLLDTQCSILHRSVLDILEGESADTE